MTNNHKPTKSQRRRRFALACLVAFKGEQQHGKQWATKEWRAALTRLANAQQPQEEK